MKEIIFTAEYGVNEGAEMLGISKKDLFQVLRESEVDRRPQDSWYQACRRYLKEKHDYSFTSVYKPIKVESEEPIFEQIS